MKTEKKLQLYDPELTAEDYAAIKRSEEEIERGEVVDIEEVFEELRNLYPNSQVYN